MKIPNRAIPPGFKIYEIVVAPGSEHAYIEAEWTGALVLVERGNIEI